MGKQSGGMLVRQSAQQWFAGGEKGRGASKKQQKVLAGCQITINATLIHVK